MSTLMKSSLKMSLLLIPCAKSSRRRVTSDRRVAVVDQREPTGHSPEDFATTSATLVHCHDVVDFNTSFALLTAIACRIVSPRLDSCSLRVADSW